MSLSQDQIEAAYQKIARRFPAEWPVMILGNAYVGRRKTIGNLELRWPFAPAKAMEAVEDIDYSLHVTAGGVDYVEIDVDLDDIEAAAEAIMEQIAAADMADPAKSRRGLDRLAAAVGDTDYEDYQSSGGSGRAA